MRADFPEPYVHGESWSRIPPVTAPIDADNGRLECTDLPSVRVIHAPAYLQPLYGYQERRPVSPAGDDRDHTQWLRRIFEDNA
jgi:hypothetical protein